MSHVGFNHHFKDWLLEEMVKRDWSQADLARSADLNRAVINKLLNGNTIPRPATLEALARAFKTPVEKVYRIAGLLPEVSEVEDFVEELSHLGKQIRSPQRKATALVLLKALVAEEDQDQNRK